MKNLDFLNSHKKPISRRDFVSLGLAAGGVSLFGPSLSALIPQTADAQILNSLLESPERKNIPFIVFDLAGGAALFANFLVGMKNGPTDLMPSYSMQGWDPRKTQIVNEFGAPMAGQGVSQILAGMQSVLNPEAQSKFRMATLLHKGEADTNNNPFSIASLVTHCGNRGQFIANSIGLGNSISGACSSFALNDVALRAFYMADCRDITNVVGLSEKFKSTLNKTGVEKLAKFINRLSQAQAQKFLQAGISDEQLKFIDEKYNSSAALMAKEIDADPRNNPVMQSIYQISPSSDPKNLSSLRAAAVQACLKGWSGPAVIHIQGCDYHDGTQQTGDAKDLEVGIEIGRAVAAAQVLNKPLFIQIITDGGIYPEPGSRIWKGDTIDSCMSVIGFFDPQKSPMMKKTQIGAYTSGQGADRSTLIGDNELNAAYAAFANYLSASGRLDEFHKILPNVFSLPGQMDQILAF